MRSLVCICPNMHNDRWPYSNYPQLIGTATDQVPTTKPILLPPTLGKIHSVHRLSTRDLRVEREPPFWPSQRTVTPDSSIFHSVPILHSNGLLSGFNSLAFIINIPKPPEAFHFSQIFFILSNPIHSFLFQYPP